MANTYIKIYLHLIFAVKHRNGLINPFWQTRLHDYIAGIIRNKNCYPIKIGGTDDHIHILLSYNPTTSLPDLVRDIKSFSSRWINDSLLSPFKFEWQKGYACVSYSQSHIEQVANYIAHQSEHHKGHSLRDEITDILTKFGIEFDEKYIFSEPV